VKLRDLCPGGALIEGDALPVEGSRVLFCREHLRVSGRVAWSHGRRAGLAFDAQIHPEDVLRSIGSASVPAVHKTCRRPGVKSHQLSPEDMNLIRTWS